MRSTRQALEQYAVSPEELDAQEAIELPERTALSLVNANLAIPVNLALATNILSDNAAAVAGAVQQAPINQGLLGQPVTTLPTP